MLALGSLSLASPPIQSTIAYPDGRVGQVPLKLMTPGNCAVFVTP
jgi:hypothetical protein